MKKQITKTNRKLVIGLVVALALIGFTTQMQAQLFTQTFNTGTVLNLTTGTARALTTGYDCVGSTAASQFTNLSCINKTSCGLAINDATNAPGALYCGGSNTTFYWSFIKTTNFAATAPTAIKVVMNATFTVNSSGTNMGVGFAVGSTFTEPLTSTVPEANAKVHSGFFLHNNSSPKVYTYSDANTSSSNTSTVLSASAITSGTNYTYTWVINNSGTTLSYTNPAGGTTTLADDKWDLWIGTTLYVTAAAATTTTQSLQNLYIGNNVGKSNSFLLNDITVTDLTPSGGGGTAPTITTGTIGTPTTSGVAVMGNSITNIGTANVTADGIAWSTTSGSEATGSNSVNNTGLNISTVPTNFDASASSLTANTKYYINAFATNSVNTSWGTESNFTTYPAAPTIASAGTPTSSSIICNWTAPSPVGTAAYDYYLEYGTDNTFGTTTGNATIASGTLTKTITGLAPGTTYYYHVKARNISGAQSGAWTSSYGTTATTASALSAPVVTAGATSVSTTGFTAQWADVANESSYTLTVYDGSNAVVGTPITGIAANSTSQAVTGLTSNTSYYYKVTAVGDGTHYTNTTSLASANVRTKSTASLITAFSISGQTSSNIIGTEIAVLVSASANVTSLTPTITLSPNATVSPLTGVAQDFTNPVQYTVTAEDGVTQTVYTVTVTKSALTKLSTPDLSSGATSATNQGFTARWTAVSNVSTYTVKVYDATGTTEVVAARHTGVSGTSVGITGLTANTTYTYKVTAIGDGSSYADSDESAASATVRTLSTASAITAFSISGQNSSNISGTDISVVVPYSTSKSSLTPSITVSSNATVSPTSRTAQDFSSPVQYTVTAEDGTTQTVYTVTVTNAAPSSAKAITALTFTGQIGSSVITESTHTIDVVMPSGTIRMSLAPVSVTKSDFTSISPAISTSRDFRTAKVYTVTAEDGSTQDYTVNVTNQGVPYPDVNAYFGSDFVASASYTFSTTDQVYSTSTGGTTFTASTFSANTSNLCGSASKRTQTTNIVLKLTGTSASKIVIIGSSSGSSARSISSIATSNTLTGTYTTLTSLSPSSTITGSSCGSITIPGLNLSSGTYVLLTFNGNTNVSQFTITPIGTQSSATQLTAPMVGTASGRAATGFTANWTDGSNEIGYTINVYKTSDNSLATTLSAAANASSVYVTGLSANTSYYYKVKALGDGDAYTDSNESTASASVSTFNTAKDITAFTIAGVSGTIGSNTIIATVPFTTNLTNLSPTISISGVSVSPSSGSAQDFSSPVDYTVTAEDASTKVYTVTISKASASHAADITAFTISGQIGSTTISGTAISVVMPYGTDKSSLTPTITTSLVATVSPLSGVAANFTSPKTFTVTAEDGTTTQDYSVTVSIGTPSVTACAGPYSFTTNGNVASAAQTCTTVNGSNLVTDISVSVDAPFQVSNDNSTWGTTTSIAKTGFAVTNATLYFRYYPTSGTCSDAGTVTLSATGATSQTFSVSGTASTAITAQSSANVYYAIGAATPALSVTAAGLGTLTYQWYSNTSASNTGGSSIDGQTSATYMPSTATLGTSYFYCVVGSNCGNVTSAAITVNVVQYATNDFGCIGSGTWATAGTWKKWDGSGWNTIAAAAPTTGDNVWIVGGYTVTVGAAGVCKDLHVVNGTLKTGNACTGTNSTAGIIGVSGTTVEVSTGGTIGNGLEDDSADAISLQFNNAGTTTITGTGGVIDVSKFILGAASATVVVNHDIDVHYHGSAFAGNAFGLYANADLQTLTINEGKTVTLTKWSSMGNTSGSHSYPATSFTVNVNGALTIQAGKPTGNSQTWGWAGSGTSGNAYLVCNAASGDLFTLAIGATGTVNVPEFYPNGTKSDGTAGTGSVSAITIASGGLLNVGVVADLRNATQSITSDGAFTLASGATLKTGNATGVSGSIAVTGTKTFSSAANYEFSGAATGSFTTSPTAKTVNSLTINNTSGVTLSSDFTASNLTINASSILTVPAGKQLTVSTALTNNGTLKLLSNATGTATIMTPSSITGNGTTNVSQYLTTGRNWYISSPVSDGTTAVFNPEGGSNHLYWYDETHGSTKPWPYSTRNDSTLEVMRGYVANMATDGVVTFNGTLNTGDKSIALSRTTGQTKEGFNLVGNPYASYLDWDMVTKSASMQTSIWQRSKNSIEDPVTHVITSNYVFDTYNASGQVGTNNSGKNITNHIPPMQAFWVRVDNGQTSGSLNVDNTMRSHKGSQTTELGGTVIDPIFKSKSTSTQSILKLQVSNGVNTDETIVYTNLAASNNFDQYDSPKMFNNSAYIAEIYTIAGTEDLAINGLNTIPYETEIPLGFSTVSAGVFSLKASQINNFEAGTQIILKDYLNTSYPVITDLSDGSSYSFTSEISSNNTSRFTLIFRAPSIATGINSMDNGSFWISTNSNGQIMINGNGNGETTIAVYNTIGQRMAAKKLTSNINVLDTQLVPGVYTITLTNAGKSATTKVIIK